MVETCQPASRTRNINDPGHEAKTSPPRTLQLRPQLRAKGISLQPSEAPAVGGGATPPPGDPIARRSPRRGRPAALLLGGFRGERHRSAHLKRVGVGIFAAGAEPSERSESRRRRPHRTTRVSGTSTTPRAPLSRAPAGAREKIREVPGRVRAPGEARAVHEFAGAGVHREVCLDGIPTIVALNQIGEALDGAERGFRFERRRRGSIFCARASA